MRNKFLGMLGLARRAGKTECGEGRVLSAIRGGRVRALIIASDASQNSKKKLLNACKYYSVPSIECADAQTLGTATGGNFAAAVAVTDESFAAELLKLGEIAE